MEILESQDPEKKRLIEASERHKRALEKEVSDLSTRTEKVLTNALIIGGALALSYILVRQFSSSGKSKKPKKQKKAAATPIQVATDTDDDDEAESPGLLANIGSKIADQATLILIDIAREKLLDYLERRKTRE